MFFLCILLLLAAHAGADPPLPEQPGYVEFASLGLFDDPQPEANIEIYLKDQLLSVVAAATRHDDEELADMLKALHLIRVQGYEKAEGRYQYERVAARLKGLTLPAWERMVRVRQPAEHTQVQVYVRTLDEVVVGLLVLVAAPEQLLFINIVGPLDLAQVGRIGRRFDIAPLDSLDFGHQP